VRNKANSQADPMKLSLYITHTECQIKSHIFLIFLVASLPSSYKLMSFSLASEQAFCVKLGKMRLKSSPLLPEMEGRWVRMGEEISQQTRRELVAVNAVEPKTGKGCIVYISTKRIQEVGRRSIGQALECKELVTQVLQTPTRVFQGLRWDEDEKGSKSPGWRSYCKIPTHSYSENGEKRPPRPNRVFMVCVNVDHVAFNWDWVRCDPRNPECPVKYDTRFKEPVL